MFRKHKNSGQIKVQGCADGRHQHTYMSKEDMSSPMVVVKTLMLSCTIDSKEQQDVETAENPGAFRQI